MSQEGTQVYSEELSYSGDIAKSYHIPEWYQENPEWILSAVADFELAEAEFAEFYTDRYEWFEEEDANEAGRITAADLCCWFARKQQEADSLKDKTLAARKEAWLADLRIIATKAYSDTAGSCQISNYQG